MARSVSAVPPLAAGYLYVRALAAGAVMFHARRVPRAAVGESIVVCNQRPMLTLAPDCAPYQFASNERLRLLHPRCELQAKCMALARLAQGRFPQRNKSHSPSTGFALNSNSMQTHVLAFRRSSSQPRAKCVVTSRSRRARWAAVSKRVAACENKRPNPSIEGTHNGGAQLRAPSRAVPPLCAPHVKR